MPLELLDLERAGGAMGANERRTAMATAARARARSRCDTLRAQTMAETCATHPTVRTSFGLWLLPKDTATAALKPDEAAPVPPLGCVRLRPQAIYSGFGCAADLAWLDPLRSMAASIRRREPGTLHASAALLHKGQLLSP